MKTKIFLKIFFFILIFLNPSFAEVIKPNSSIDPSQVVKIQLSALMKNDFPNKDGGIEQTWEFAHPNNQKITGPIERFKYMMKSDS